MTAIWLRGNCSPKRRCLSVVSGGDVRSKPFAVVVRLHGCPPERRERLGQSRVCVQDGFSGTNQGDSDVRIGAELFVPDNLGENAFGLAGGRFHSGKERWQLTIDVERRYQGHMKGKS